MTKPTNGCGNTLRCDDTHDGARCELQFICNSHPAGYHATDYGPNVRTHSHVF